MGRQTVGKYRKAHKRYMTIVKSFNTWVIALGDPEERKKRSRYEEIMPQNFVKVTKGTKP